MQQWEEEEEKRREGAQEPRSAECALTWSGAEWRSASTEPATLSHIYLGGRGGEERKRKMDSYTGSNRFLALSLSVVSLWSLLSTAHSRKYTVFGLLLGELRKCITTKIRRKIGSYSF